MNEDLSELKGYFFRDQKKEGLEAADRILAKLDFDDDDDMEILLDVIATGLFRGDEIGIIDLLKKYRFDFSSKWPGKGNSAFQCVDNYCYDPDIFDALVSEGASFDSTSRNGSNVLHLIMSREISMFDKMSEPFAVHLIRKYDLTALFVPDPFGALPLHQAILHNREQSVQAMLEKGVDVNALGTKPNQGMSHAVQFDGVSALDLAAWNGNSVLAGLLLKYGADTSLKDHKGRSAYFYAVDTPNQHFCKPYFSGIPGEEAVRERKREIIQMLSDGFDDPDENGTTPLLYALNVTRFDQGGYAAAFIEKGADIEAANHNGRTPLMAAAENMHQESLKLLVENGAGLNRQDRFGNTALHYAVLAGNEKQGRYLVKKGADFMITDNNGKTALDIVSEKGMTDLLELMI